MRTFLTPGLQLLYLSALHLGQEATEGDSFHSNLWLPWLAFLLLNAWVRSDTVGIFISCSGATQKPLTKLSRLLTSLSCSDVRSHTLTNQSTVLPERIWSYFFWVTVLFPGSLFRLFKTTNRSFPTYLLGFFSPTNNQTFSLM